MCDCLSRTNDVMSSANVTNLFHFYPLKSPLFERYYGQKLIIIHGL